MQRIERALLSVHDKSGLSELGRALARHGTELLSTGGTAALLRTEGVAVTDVSTYTGAPEILGGRVKTIHPRIAGGLLAVRDDPAHLDDLERNGILPIDLVAVNLYPFEQTVAKGGVTLEEAIENIDIGGPTLLRAAAKNHRHVAVLTDPGDYAAVIAELAASGGALSLATRERLAVQAFEAVARYDAAVATWLAARLRREEVFPSSFAIGGSKVQDLRYGENPHQRAAFYRTARAGFGVARQHQGKELSYNNLLDLDAAVAAAREFAGLAAAVIVKHTNPCGVATAAALDEAYRMARATDPTSAFGGVVALTGEVDAGTARELTRTFIEAVAAPGFRPEALEVLGAKKQIRVIELPFTAAPGPVVRQVAGGLLVQTPDDHRAEFADLKVVTKRVASEAELKAMRFAWAVAKHVKSNAIVFTRESQTVAIGAGQMSRVDSARIATEKAVLPLAGTVVASDAFFPFRDGLDVVARAGATAVIQPGGSVRDEEVIAAADEHGMAMVFTGVRHFRH